MSYLLHPLRSAATAVPAVALLFLGACSTPRAPLPTAPPPIAVPEPEAVFELPEILGEEIAAVPRDLLGGVAYDLPVEANSWVEAEIDFLVGQRREVIGRWMERGDYYEPYIKDILRSYGLPTDLFHLAMIESGFLPAVRSRAGAVGMWQFMSATGRSEGLRIDSLVDERMDPVRATHAAARHLRTLHRQFGDWALAAAAYNAGSGRVSRGLKGFGVSNYWDLAQQGDLAEETKHYVPRLYAMTVITRGRDRFGFPAAPQTEGFRYDSVNVEYATPLDVLAKLGGASEEELARLNPHLLRKTTPAGGYWVWVPAGKGVELQRAYLASDFRREQGYGVYVVRGGDNLGRLAEFAEVRSSRIRELNPDVDFDRLQIGAKLRLPYRAAEALAARPRASQPEKAREVAPAAKEAPRYAAAVERSHEVAEGETLWELARDYQVTVEQLQEANELVGSTIRPGQTLRIPGGEAAAPKVTEHVVQSGESLWGIARQYGRSVAELQKANNLGDGSTIRPGQKLVVPGQ